MAKIDTSASNVATSALQALPFGQIIGGPLKACIDAQTEAALSTWNYINSVGITTNEAGDAEAVYVKFAYRSNGKRCELSIPLLTLVPIPYLAIKDISIGFKANISASSSASDTIKKSTSMEVGMKASAGFNVGLVHVTAEMSASVSSKKDSTSTRDSKYSVEYTMDVAVKAGQDDMPAGMSKVLEILNNSIETIDSRGELIVSASEVRLVDGVASVFVVYKRPDGYYETEASEIKVSGGSGKIDKQKTGNGFMLKFSSAGDYKVKAGNDLQETVVVK